MFNKIKTIIFKFFKNIYSIKKTLIMFMNSNMKNLLLGFILYKYFLYFQL